MIFYNITNKNGVRLVLVQTRKQFTTPNKLLVILKYIHFQCVQWEISNFLGLE